MATDCSLKGTLAAAAALAQLLCSSCQPAESNQAASAVTGGSSATVKPAATGAAGAGQAAAAGRSGANTPSTAPASTGKAGAGSAPPAAVSGSGAAGVRAAGASGSTAGSSGGATATAQAGSAGKAEAGAAGSAKTSPTAGSLPALTDFKAKGPFTSKREAGPSGYVLYYPQELGKDGAQHPILSWGPGAAETAADFSMLLSHLASHGFAVISFDGTPQGQELVTGIDWLLAENMRAESVFYKKLDATKISAGGHSAGSLATFVIGADKRLITTLHISGGTFDPHTDIMNLHAPALFVCGEPGGDGLLMGDIANPNCQIDFDNAMVPVFYGITKGASHMTPTDIGDATVRSHQFGAMVGWLRWQLAGDTNAKAMFVGDSCTLCADSAWSTAKSKNLN